MTDDRPVDGSLLLDIKRGLVQLPEGWRVLVQRRWILFTSLLVVVSTALAYSFLATPLYRSAATLQIAPQTANVLTTENVTAVDPSYTSTHQDFYHTQSMILKSRRVIELAVERLDLVNRPEFLNRNNRPVDRLSAWVRTRMLGLQPGTPHTTEAAVAFVRSHLRVEPVRYTQLVEIAFVDRSPQLARDVVNAVAEAYIQFDFSSWHDTTRLAREFLTKEVARVQREIAELEHRLQQYSSQEEILALSDGLEDISEQALGTLNRSYVDALSRLAEAEANLQAVLGSPPHALPEVINSALISTLKQEYARLERRHSQLSDRFKGHWPPLRETQEELDKARERLELEIQGVAAQAREAARAAYLRAKAELENVERQLAEQKTEVHRVKRAGVEYAGLRAAVETKRNVLSNLVARQSEAETSVRLEDTEKKNIRFIDRAEAGHRSSPRPLRNLVLSLVVGTLLGVFMAFALDHLDNSVKSESDIQRVCDAPVLAHIPFFQPLRVLSGDDRPRDAASHVVALASHLDPASAFVEAFKNLRTSLLLAMPDHPPRQIAVSSCDAADGKTTVSLNLAIVLTQLGRRVLLVDADLRRPRLHKVLRLGTGVGLSSLLSGNASTDQVIQETEIPRLQALPCGPVPPNPSELVDSPAFVSLLDHLERTKRFDHIVFDSSPLVSIADTVTLATKVDATVLVLRAGRTSRNTLAHSISRLTRAARANLVGIVLNAVTEQDQRYYYYGYHYRTYDRDEGARGRREELSALRGRLLRRRRG